MMKVFSQLRFHLPDDSNLGQADKKQTRTPGVKPCSLPWQYLPVFLFSILEASFRESEDWKAPPFALWSNLTL